LLCLAGAARSADDAPLVPQEIRGASGAPAGYEPTAKQILDTAGIQGGLIVHLGCGDGQLTAALHRGDQFLVHGLDADAKNVEVARQNIRALGLYGKVSVEQWSGPHLPYAENLVNLLVAENLGGVAMDEVMRVLSPDGVAFIDGRKTVKPWPKEMDEWTHHLHDAGGNPVAHDTLVGPPQHLQWAADPLWARGHGWTPSVSDMVSSHGRFFYICDETLTGANGTVPDNWVLVARDAFNGVLLWKRPVPHWGSEAFSGTPGSGAGVTKGRFTMPPNLGKRLVASGDTVYVTLGASAPVTALDAVTGAVRQVYDGTGNADEILCVDGRLVVSLNPGEAGEAASQGKQVCAVDPATGRVLWKKGPFAAVRATRQQDPFGRLELAAGDGQVFLLTETAIQSLNLNSGETVWQMARPALPATAALGIYPSFGVYEYRLTVMVYHVGVVLLAQPEPEVVHTYNTVPGSLYAFDAKTGRQMWKHAYGAWGHDTQPDVFVANGLVWTHMHHEVNMRGKVPVNDAEENYCIQGLDLRTGQMRRQLATDDIFNVGHHHRCYRNKITDQFLLSSRRGIEFVNLASGENYQNHWVRSGCLLGYLPCNGLLYVTPHPCACYLDAKLTGFNALAPRRNEPVQPTTDAERLERGPAFSEITNLESQISDSDWPTYRHDSQRSGATEAPVGLPLAVRWSVPAGGKLSAPVIAGGMLFVADVDRHAVQALDGGDGRPLWRFTAGGRVDSPPTIHQGLALFGSADGRVYAVRDSDGALAWRFAAAPTDQRLCAFGQLESAWPVPGSVLVKDGRCWFAAGRSSYLDSGIRLYALEPLTGKIGHRETIYHPDAKTGKMAVTASANQMDGLLNDIPSSDSTSVFIRQMNVLSPGVPAGLHLFSNRGFLDSSWFNRTAWTFGAVQTKGLMVLGQDAVFGVDLAGVNNRDGVFKPGGSGYQLLCHPLKQATGEPDAKAVKRGKAKKDPSTGGWDQRLPIRITALVRAADVIFAAGSPDALDPADPYGAWEGRKGGVVAAFSAKDGKKLGEWKLPSPPVWDGMAAAGGCLYVSLMDGKVLCLAAP